MEGWNDCPLPMLSNRGTQKAKKRTARPSAMRMGIPGATQVNMSSDRFPRIDSVSSIEGATRSLPQDLETILRNVINIYNLLGQKGEVFAEKLIIILRTLDEQDKNFLDLILTMITTNERGALLRGRINEFMIANEDSCEWCNELKLLVAEIYVE